MCYLVVLRSFQLLMTVYLYVCVLSSFLLQASTLLAFREQSNIFVLYFLTLSQLTKKKKGERESMRMEEQERSKNIVNATSA